jgi:hypothetical protein
MIRDGSEYVPLTALLRAGIAVVGLVQISADATLGSHLEGATGLTFAAGLGVLGPVAMLPVGSRPRSVGDKSGPVEDKA